MKAIVKFTLLILFAVAILSISLPARAAAHPAAVLRASSARYCAGGVQHPLINGIAAKYNTPAAELTEWNCGQGHDLGEIMLAIHTSMAAQNATAVEILTARAEGNSWDSIWNELHLINSTSLTALSESSRQNNRISLSGILMVAAFTILVYLASQSNYNIRIPKVIGQSVIGNSKLNPTGPPKNIFHIRAYPLINPIPIL